MVEGPPRGDLPRHRRPSSRIPSGFKTIRDLVSYIAGLAIVGHEVFFTHAVQPLLIGVGGALLGLPIVFGADERRSKGGPE